MRITNQMMTSNLLNNITRNKLNMSVLGDQYATGQKIQRPSEDPVVAVRSLKYRTQLRELEQYYGKNIPDAKAWMDITESALDAINGVLEGMNTYCNQGANDTLEVKERNSIIENLQEYQKQIYQYGNTDYAGRYVFTGYRTDTPFLFDKPSEEAKYTIKENFTSADIDVSSHVANESTYNSTYSAEDYAKNAPYVEKAHRIQLAYGNLDQEAASKVNLSYVTTAPDGTTTITEIGRTGTTVTKKDKDGKVVGTPEIDNTRKLLVVSKNDMDTHVPEAGVEELYYIPETGEIILPDKIHTQMQEATSIQVEYDKSNFKEGDIRPEHYYACSIETKDKSGNPVITEYSEPTNQNIQYEVNFSQKLTVNTLACNSISTDIGRRIEEMVNSVKAVESTETKLSEVKKMISETTDEQKLKDLSSYKEQVETELVLKKKLMQEKFSAGISMTTEAQESINIALANHGSRYVRLKLTEERLANQKVDFTEMLKNNDSVNMEDAIINYNAAEVTYNASLSAAGKVVTNTLLDFI